MKLKNLFLILNVTFLAGFLLADNPGDEVVETAEAVEAVEETVQEEVASDESTDSSSGSESADDEVVALEKVVVTGSRIKKTQVEGPLPLLVITKEDIDNKGFRNLTEVLQSVPSANAGTQNESKNINFTPNANELDLRNLGPGRVLYLINGRRTADYPVPLNNRSSFVNVGTIPNGLIDRVEILSQGASAIYGSDAVTGVVNVITMKGKDFQEFDVDFIETEYEGKNQYSIAYTAGGFTGNSSWTVGVDISHVDPMTYADRPNLSSFTESPRAGVSYNYPRYGMYWSTGIFTGDFQGWYGNSEFPSTPTCEETGAGEFAVFDKQDPEWLYTGSFPGQGCLWDYGSERFGGSSQTIVNERDDIAVMATFTHNFDNGIELNARLTTYYDEAFSRSIPRVARDPDEIVLDPLRIMGLTATSTDPANVTGPLDTQLGLRSYARYMTPAMGDNADARRDYTEEVTDVFIGLNGFFKNGFEWEFGVNTTTYDFENEQKQLTTRMQDYLNCVGCTDANGNLLTGTYRNYQYDGDGRLAFLNSIDFFSDLGRVATANDALAAYGLPTDPVCGELQFGRYQPCFVPERYLGLWSNELIGSWLEDDTLTASSEQTHADFVVNGEFELGDRFVGFAATLEHQQQEYKVGPTRTDPSIEFVQGVGYSGGGDRSRTSIGVELLFPVTDKLEMTLATRNDKYDDDSSNVGSRQSSMINFAYRPNDKLLIRGSASETFRAPDMNYLFAGISQGYYNGVLDWVGCYVNAAAEGYLSILDCEDAAVSVKTTSVGNTELEEEEGKNYQLGLVWDINQNWDMTIDLYQVVLENLIGTESFRTLNITEGLCLYGDDFKAFILSERDNNRDCAETIGKIGRATPTPNPITGVTPALGEWTDVFPEFVNTAFREYQGADWQLNYRVETENAGDFSFSVLSSHIIAYYSKFDENSDEINWINYYTYEPRSQQNASINWRYQDWSTTLFMDRTGHMELGSTGKTDPHIITNLSTYYNYSANLSMYLSIRNLDDKMPQRDVNYGYPYYNQNYFSAFGRYVSAGFNYRF